MIECKECKQCNRIGKPSVTRGSYYCRTHKIDRGIVNRGLFKRLLDKIYAKQNPIDENGVLKTHRIKKKGGFRF